MCKIAVTRNICFFTQNAPHIVRSDPLGELTALPWAPNSTKAAFRKMSNNFNKSMYC